MQTITLRGSESIIHQLLSNVEQLVKEGQEIEVLATNTASNNISWQDFLQDKKVIQDIQESLEQIERGETYDQEEAFKIAFERLGL